jgi:hypothetical protein
MAEKKNVPLIHFNAHSWDIILVSSWYHVKIGLIMSVYLDPKPYFRRACCRRWHGAAQATWKISAPTLVDTCLAFQQSDQF